MLMINSELAARVGWSTPTLWHFRKRNPNFPKPICIEGGSVLRWVSEEVDAWLLSRRNNERVK